MDTLAQGHLSYISNIRSYAKVYHCVKCERDFLSAFSLGRHEKICNSIPEEKFVGGYKHLKLTVFERLESYGIHVDLVDRYCRDFIVFDCESILQPIKNNSSEITGKKQKRHWTAVHLPVSVAMTATFMPEDPETGYPRTECIVSRDPSVLISEFLTKLMGWRTRIVDEARKRYKPVKTKLKALIADYQAKENAILEELTSLTEEDLQKSETKTVVWCRSLIKDLQSLQSEFKQYVEQVVVLGLLKLIDLLKEHLISQYLRNYTDKEEGDSIKVIKQQAAYSSLELSDKLIFLDVYKYQSPNTTLDSFMKAEGTSNKSNDRGAKFSFPYEWFDSYDKLDYPGLPPPEVWFSKLKGCNVLGTSAEEIQENFTLCQKKLDTLSKNPKFQDFLVYYNSMDMGPMLSACRR